MCPSGSRTAAAARTVLQRHYPRGNESRTLGMSCSTSVLEIVDLVNFAEPRPRHWPRSPIMSPARRHPIMQELYMRRGNSRGLECDDVNFAPGGRQAGPARGHDSATGWRCEIQANRYRSGGSGPDPSRRSPCDRSREFLLHAPFAKRAHLRQAERRSAPVGAPRDHGT